MKIAVVGATGMVGQVMLQVLHERGFENHEILPVASDKSKGKEVAFADKKLKVIGLKDALEAKPDMALFSAGGGTSLEWAPKFAEQGCYVIDNSSAWRMEEGIPLVVPEINGDLLEKGKYIIANPNCSTIQMLMVLAPLHRKYGIDRVVVSTYQSITGTGVKAVQQLENEKQGLSGEMAYPYPIHENALPHCDVFMENGYTKEEMKLVNETHKILDPTIAVTATAVRIPVKGGHSESVNLEFKSEYQISDLKRLLAESPGISLQDNTDVNQYPMPRYAEGKDEVFVGRIRRDLSKVNALNLWIVADNLRKGAATNAVQIAEMLQEKGIV
ncbi:aspartate-semialdehyde dehydrogenase [Croceimicrobium hydrocarbonivorans]|uniref:Aspartate-semialdehyde dehydrogenase n=1 Tax=Croceimicrobium hydrocarbonivorans TaxID=2761580 RepID=A0A7H0VJQ5_9FLAO|nr:aspartate-semialdehyde dehydrogenase [Croceimicrobium hydrocarbonivorans]QNR25953.1 aspartate-semialdehyde dehydrogenase [Croceimicrobium hydrocarbonivorans]